MDSQESERPLQNGADLNERQSSRATRRAMIRKVALTGGLVALSPWIECMTPPAVSAVPPAPVTIVYPINGATYPVASITPPGTVASAYITASFSVTCAG